MQPWLGHLFDCQILLLLSKDQTDLYYFLNQAFYLEQALRLPFIQFTRDLRFCWVREELLLFNNRGPFRSKWRPFKREPQRCGTLYPKANQTRSQQPLLGPEVRSNDNQSFT